MENKKNTGTQKISSRNRNKTKNKNLQIKAKEKELAKKTRVKKEKVVQKKEVVEEVRDVRVREEVQLVPERKNVVVSDTINDTKKSSSLKKTDNRFNFVEDAQNDFDDFNELEEFLDYKNVESVPVQEIRQLERAEVKDDEEIIAPPTSNVDVNAKAYFSFENRIIVLLVLIVVSFFVAGLLIFKSITHTDTAVIVFDDKSNVEYSVCINDTASSQYYSNECLDEEMEYLTSITESVPVTFRYEMLFNRAVSTNVSYYVVSKVNVYREKNGKVLNTMEDVLVERTVHSVFGDEASLAIDVEVPFKKYVEYVNSYNSQYGLDSYADLEIMLYIDNGNVIKKVANAKLPLTMQTFSVDVMESVNREQNLTLASDSWGSVNTSYAVVGVIFVLFGVLGIIRLANLIFKVVGNSSVYQRKLSKILKEYDRYIVISRGEYTIDDSKRLVKVTTFGELLDARNTLEKPIVYVKVNNVKSEFYVEDSEAIYKYTLKEADVEEKK